MKTRLLKLEKMSAKEILFRINEKIYKEYEKRGQFLHRNGSTEDRLLNSFAINITGKRLDKTSLLQYIKTRDNVNFFVDGKNQKSFSELVEKIFPDTIENSIKKADLVCSHNFFFLGINPKYNSKIHWNKDPLTLDSWPMVFYDDLNQQPESGIDIKYVWELNRHQFFVDLGKAYWLTGDEKYAKEFFALIDDWIDSNPFRMGVNWTSSLELSVRSISWLWAYCFCKDSKHLTAELNLKILTSLHQHAGYIYKHLSVYSSPYNHLIGELAGLFMIGIMFPEFKDASIWVKESWQLLNEELPKQFYEDGGTIEQAAFYHHFTVGFYLMVFLLGERNGLEASRKIWSILERTLEFAMYLTKPDGTVPMIGDVDSARSIYVENPQPWDFRAFLSTGAVLFNRGDMKFVSGGFKEDSLWLLGIEGVEKYNMLSAKEPAETSKALKESGYYIMRSGWKKDSHYLCFDCGEQAAGLHSDSIHSAAHGHADFLSIEVAINGRSFLVDPGFYTYNGRKEWRDYFRKTMAHNTVVGDEKDQSLHLGGMDWSDVTKPELNHWISTNAFDYVGGSHRGYGSSIVHFRAIFFKKHEYWIVNDSFQGTGEHLLDTYWHFAPGELRSKEDLKTVFTNLEDNNNLLIQPVDPAGLQLKILAGGSAPTDGWIAPGYGVKLKAPVAKYSFTAKAPCSLNTILFPFHGRCNGLAVELMDTTDGAKAFEIKLDKYSDGFVFNDCRLKNICIGNIQTDAGFLHYRKDLQGKYCEIAVIHGSFVKIDDKVYLDLKKPVEHANILNRNRESVVMLPENELGREKTLIL